MATQTGKLVNFGFTGTDGIAATGLTGNGLFQSADIQTGHDEVQLKDAAGELATRIFANTHEKASIEWIPAKDSVANAITAQGTIYALIRTILNITTCASFPELVHTNWLVVDIKVTKSNSDASKLTLSLERHAGITTSPA